MTPMIQRRKLIANSSFFAASVSLPNFGRAAQHRLGLSLPLSGTQAEVAKDLMTGYELALRAAGGNVTLKVLDDSGSPEKAAKNVEALGLDPQVIGLSGIVGTPHAQLALPVAVKFGLPVVGIRSGAAALRDGRDGVYHLRASFEDELNKIAGMCDGAGYKRVLIIYSEDSFGKGSNEHLISRLKSLGINETISYPVDRNGEKMDKQLDAVGGVIKKSTIGTAVVLLMITQPMVRALKVLRENYHSLSPTFAMSFVAGNLVIGSRDPSLSGLGVVAAFPPANAINESLIVQYKKDFAEFGSLNLAESPTVFEGYLYGSVFMKAIAETASRQALVSKLNKGVTFAGQEFKFNDKKVGFSYLKILYKNSNDGRFRV